MIYTGYQEVKMSNPELAHFYEKKENSFYLLENEYLLIKNEYDEIVDKYVWQAGEMRRVKFNTINSRHCGVIKPRNVYQELAVDMLQDRSTPVKLFQGTYGSGKDFLMSAEAAALIEKGIFSKLVYIRPNVSLGSVPEIGFLKGGLDEKLGWTMAPLWDKFGGPEAIDNLQLQGTIELVPLPFIRGRSFDNCIVYVSEGQNITREVAAVITSRLGDHSELWINGDCHGQTDSRIYDEDNGIRAMIETLKGDKLFQMVYSPLTERSDVARLAAKIIGTK